MTSDGLIDQVGGARSRMFGKKRFVALLAELQGKPMSEQKDAIYDALVTYQGDQVRRDDVSVVGFIVRS
jgi:serine phosphatase RsbU (regulator of sigma subunit)